MTAVRRIDTLTARRLAVAKQRLSGAAPRSSPVKVLDVVRSIRCVQLDPISVVARSPLLVLRSRLRGFEPAHLDRLLWHDRSLFEYWAHAASIVLTEDYPIHHYRMRNFPTPGGWGARFGDWVERNDALRRSILRDLRRRGPLRLRDLADHAVSESWVSTGWTRDRNADQMLRYLWIRGTVMVAERRGLEKWWDLAERILPAEARRERIRDAEVTRRAAELSLQALGVATPAHIRSHFTIDRYPELPGALERLERRGRISRVEVAADGDRLPGVWYVHAEDLAELDRLARGSRGSRTTLLSPFDNLIHDRKRAHELFGLDYRMEIYVPKAKRRFGYYAMPVLHEDRFVARVDPAADRERGRLVINAVHTEPGVRPTRELGLAVAGAIHDLAEWTGASRIDVEGSAPDTWRRAIS
ncbi:MAG: winged helix-turn-helix domain-containing protein [Actinomycetota bacterium]